MVEINGSDIELQPDDMKEYRTALNLSQSEMAYRLGVDRTTWSRWESGSLRPHHRRMLKAALNWLVVEHQVSGSLERGLGEADEAPSEPPTQTGSIIL